MFQTPKYWWVNHHKTTHRQELEGEYLWSPKKNQNGAKNVSYDNMIHVMPGDVVFSFADAAIRAVGVAIGRAREAPKPPEFGAAGAQWGTDPGWQVPVRFSELTDPLRPKDHIAQLAALLPGKYSPLRASGDGNQNVYLAAVPGPMVDKLTQLLGGQVEQIVESITHTMGGSLLDDAAEERIQQRTDIGPTVKKTLVNARRGQGVFRINLEQIERKCRVTGVIDRRHLRASHIKPWCICDDTEKLDGFNGLLLAPHVHHLFDRGYVSFSDSGDLLVAKELNPAVLESWGIASPRNVGAFSKEQSRYLEYHRGHVFEKVNGGRRGASTGAAEEFQAVMSRAPVVVLAE
jgi:putative restriction endonuclease